MTDVDFKSTHAYQLIKEVQKEVYSDSNLETAGDIESAVNLNHCRDSVAAIINNFDGGAVKKADKVNKAQDVVDQAKRLMGENVKKMIDNQKDFNVRVRWFNLCDRKW